MDTAGINLYNEFYALVESIIFGGDAAMTPWTEWMTTFVATAATLALVALPFVVVYKVIRVICG